MGAQHQAVAIFKEGSGLAIGQRFDVSAGLGHASQSLGREHNLGVVTGNGNHIGCGHPG